MTGGTPISGNLQVSIGLNWSRLKQMDGDSPRVWPCLTYPSHQGDMGFLWNSRVHSPQICQSPCLQRVPAKPKLIQELTGNYNRCCPMQMGQVNSPPDFKSSRSAHRCDWQDTTAMPNNLINPAFSVNINMFPNVCAQSFLSELTLLRLCLCELFIQDVLCCHQTSQNMLECLHTEICNHLSLLWAVVQIMIDLWCSTVSSAKAKIITPSRNPTKEWADFQNLRTGKHLLINSNA